MSRSNKNKIDIKIKHHFSFNSYFEKRTDLEKVLFIICIGFLVFFNCIFNPFVLDDVSQIVYNPYILQFSNIPVYFYSSVSSPGLSGFTIFHYQYKPMLYGIYTLLAGMFGLTQAPFHILQISLFIICVILLFYVLGYFNKKIYAFFLTLLFLVHPINSEAVIYIADLQDVLFMLLGLSSFFLLVKNKNDSLSWLTILIISLFLFLSLLSKNTGILFIFILPLYAFLYSRKNFKSISAAASVILVLYFILNLISIQHVLFASLPSVIQQSTFMDRIQTMPLIFLYYIKTFLMPFHLAVVQEWLVKKITFSNFILPLVLDLIFCGSVVLFGLFLHKKNQTLFTNYLFFSIWFFLGIGFHLQFIPLDQTVADRWFLFPEVGLLGMLGITATVVFEAIHTKRILIYFLQILVWALLCLLVIVTVNRISQWHTELGLYSHDIKYSPDSALLNNNLGIALEEEGNIKGAKKYLENAVALDPNGIYLSSLGQYYEVTNNYKKAMNYYVKDINLQNGMPKYDSYAGVIRLDLFYLHNPKGAKALAQKAIRIYPTEILYLAYIAMADYQTGDKKDAIATAHTLLTYQPNQDNEELYYLIKTGKFNIKNVP